MTVYVESVEDPEQDTILSLLAYHSWRWGHQITLHRPQSGPHQWFREQTAKWDIVLQLTPEGFLHPHTRQITRHHSHCTGAAAGPTPGGRRGRTLPGGM